MPVRAKVPATRPVNHENRTVQKILEAALVVWSRDGYHGSSLQDIADEAGVAKSLLHYHFASKEHLLIELQSVHFRGVAEAVRARLATRPPSLDSALTALDEVWKALVASRRQFAFVLEVWRASLQSPAIRRRLLDFDREIGALLADGMKRALGPLAPALALPPARLAGLLQVALAGFCLRLFETDDPARLRVTFNDFKLLVRGVLTTPSGRQQGGRR